MGNFPRILWNTATVMVAAGGAPTVTIGTSAWRTSFRPMPLTLHPDTVSRKARAVGFYGNASPAAQSEWHWAFTTREDKRAVYRRYIR